MAERVDAGVDAREHGQPPGRRARDPGVVELGLELPVGLEHVVEHRPVSSATPSRNREPLAGRLIDSSQVTTQAVVKPKITTSPTLYRPAAPPVTVPHRRLTAVWTTQTATNPTHTAITHNPARRIPER